MKDGDKGLYTSHIVHIHPLSIKVYSILENPKPFQDAVVDVVSQIGVRARQIVLASSDEDARDLVVAFNRLTPGTARLYCGEWPFEKRQNMLRAFREKAVRVLVTEAIDLTVFESSFLSDILLIRKWK